jgi:predicted metal-binding membrane protein
VVLLLVLVNAFSCQFSFFWREWTSRARGREVFLGVVASVWSCCFCCAVFTCLFDTSVGSLFLFLDTLVF